MGKKTEYRFGRYIWTEIYPLDHFASGAGPGRRWKFSVVADGISMAIFGGQTLWEGSTLWCCECYLALDSSLPTLVMPRTHAISLLPTSL